MKADLLYSYLMSFWPRIQSTVALAPVANE